MRITITLILSLFVNQSIAQTYIIMGVLTGPNLGESGKVYYSFNKNERSDLFVEYDSNHQFEIIITAEQIISDTIAKLYFTNDIQAKYQCSHIINIDSLNLSGLFESDQMVKLKAYHNPFLHCDLSAMQSAEEDGNGRFLGIYKFIREGVEYELNLKDHYYGAINYFQLDRNYMNLGHSSWQYFPDKNILRISGHGRTNKTFGIYIEENWELNFSVNESSGELKFECDDSNILLEKK